MAGANFRKILTPIDLAVAASKSAEIKAASVASAIATGEGDQLSLPNLQQALDAQKTSLLNLEADLATRVVMNSILDKFLNSTGSPTRFKTIVFGSVGPGHAHVTWSDLYTFNLTMQKWYRKSQDYYLSSPAVLYAAYSNITMTTTTTSVSLGDVTLAKEGVSLSSSFEALLRNCDAFYSAYGYQDGDISFRSLWHQYFETNNSKDALSTNDYQNATSVIQTFIALINNIKDANNGVLGIYTSGATSGNNKSLSDAIKELANMQSAINDFQNKKMNTTATPATVPALSTTPPATSSDTTLTTTQYLFTNPVQAQ